MLLAAAPSFGFLVITEAKGQKDKEKIQALMSEWDNALVNRNVDFIDGILAEDFTYISSSGQVQNKAEHLALIKSPDLIIESSSSSNFVVRVYGDMAVAIAEGRIKGRYKSNSFDNHYRYTDVWVKRKGIWKAVATQITNLPQ